MDGLLVFLVSSPGLGLYVPPSSHSQTQKVMTTFDNEIFQALAQCVIVGSFLGSFGAVLHWTIFHG